MRTYYTSADEYVRRAAYEKWRLHANYTFRARSLPLSAAIDRLHIGGI